jgi:hypothetical protein
MSYIPEYLKDSPVFRSENKRFMAYVKKGHTLFKDGMIDPIQTRIKAQAVTNWCNALGAHQIVERYTPKMAHETTMKEVWFVERETGRRIAYRWNGKRWAKFADYTPGVK